MQSIYSLAQDAPRPSIVKAFPWLQPSHRSVQNAFFGAIDKADLSKDKQRQLTGINRFLGTNITSRTQLTIEEMEALITAIEAGAFTKGWQLTGRVRANVLVHVSIDLVPAAPLCEMCHERPVHYLLCDLRGELLDGESGICRECCPVQSDDSDL